MHAKSLQSCLNLCNPRDCSPPGSSVYGILQARILEWVSTPSSRGSSRPRDRTCVSWVSCIRDRFFTHWATWESPMECYSAIKRNTFESVLRRWMDLEPIIQSEVSQKETDKYRVLTHIWDLERWYWRSYMQGSKGNTDVRKRRLDSVGEGEGGMIWQNAIETCTLPYVKQMTSASSMHEARHPKLVLWDNSEG